jgi:hypothetical protein
VPTCHLWLEVKGTAGIEVVKGSFLGVVEVLQLLSTFYSVDQCQR